MRILIVTSVFAGPRSNPWLLDDLAEAFARQGHEVDVIVHDTKRPRPRGASQSPRGGPAVISVGPERVRAGLLGKIVAHARAFWGLHTLGYRHARSVGYDLCVYTTIGIFSWGLPARLRARGAVARSVFVLWDFFPIHQVEIGRLPRNVPSWPLRAIEASTFRRADVVAVMTRANEAFLRRYHHTRGQDVAIVPPWASVEVPEGTNKRDRFTVVFGGQLALGRGIDTLLRAARILQDAAPDIEVLVIGSGPTRNELVAFAGHLRLANTTFLDAMPRPDYRRLIASVHVGVAVTVPGVSPPTFPSKIAEYSALGLPTIVCVEASSDAGDIVESAGAGIAVPAGDDRALAAAVQRLYEEHERGALPDRAERARDLYRDELSVDVAARRLAALG